MRSGSVRNMYMHNSPPCAPWLGHPANRPLIPNGSNFQGPPRHPLPYYMVQAPPYPQGPSWQVTQSFLNSDVVFNIMIYYCKLMIWAGILSGILAGSK